MYKETLNNPNHLSVLSLYIHQNENDDMNNMKLWHDVIVHGKKSKERLRNMLSVYSWFNNFDLLWQLIVLTFFSSFLSIF